MTCTHAAMVRDELINDQFEYDTLIMEEAGQVLEIEAMIAMCLQKKKKRTAKVKGEGTAGEGDGDSSEYRGGCRLKRIILIGDHHQLPPVVQNMGLSKFCHFDQSLFSRLIRFGVPFIQLDKQGRTRASIADLFRWRYDRLGDLPAVVERKGKFGVGNAGFGFDYQFVNVGDYQGKGETQSVQFFYQNLGEAKFVVEVYKYMRLLGYPAKRIAILAAYNGQKALLREMIEKECAVNPKYGSPHKVTTIDRFQGLEEDYVLVSLVRSGASAGHLRDVRRWVVAVSRVRLGLWVFGRMALMETIDETKQIVDMFKRRPTALVIDPLERFSENCEGMRSCDAPVAKPLFISSADEMARINAMLNAVNSR